MIQAYKKWMLLSIYSKSGIFFFLSLSLFSKSPFSKSRVNWTIWYFSVCFYSKRLIEAGALYIGKYDR